jgi:hypothetical protein
MAPKREREKTNIFRLIKSRGMRRDTNSEWGDEKYKNFVIKFEGKLLRGKLNSK